VKQSLNMEMAIVFARVSSIPIQDCHMLLRITLFVLVVLNLAKGIQVFHSGWVHHKFPKGVVTKFRFIYIYIYIYMLISCINLLCSGIMWHILDENEKLMQFHNVN
jgi:hypothetical protein